MPTASEAETAQSLRDYARLRGQVAECLEDLARVNEEMGQPARAARIRETGADLAQQRFTLLVLGEFKRGKSTLINRLLGGDTLPVGAAPTTAVLTRVSYGEEPSARLVLEDGVERPVDIGRLAEEITLVQSDEGINQRRHAGIVRAEVTLPAPLCRDGVDLVDSPGLGEHTTRTEVTYEALPAADAVVFVSDAAQLGSEDEDFVRGKLAREDIDNVFFVINKWDRVYNETEDPEAEIAALARRAWSLFVPEPKVGYNGQDLRANRIYPLSCRPNLAPEEERGALEGLFDAFRADLEAFLVRERGQVALQRAVARARAAVAETQAGLRARGPALAADLEEFERRVAAAEAELRKLEGPRQAIRDAVASRRQAIRLEVRTRTNRELPGIESAIRDEFTDREYRPKGQLGDRILNSVQDAFRRQKIRDDLRLQVREIATAKLDPWATELNSYVENQIKELLAEVAEHAGEIEATFQQASRIISGLDQAPDTAEQDQEDMLKRGLAAGIGVLLGDPYLIMMGGMHGFKGVGRTMLYQFGLGAAGIVLVAIGLPLIPVMVTASAAGAVIAAVQSNDELIELLKKQALDEVLERLQATRTTGLGALETTVSEPLEACSVAIEKAIEGRIADHRESVEALRAQVGQAREEGAREQTRLDLAMAEVAAISTRLAILAP
jgi:hypothetical protein